MARLWPNTAMIKKSIGNVYVSLDKSNTPQMNTTVFLLLLFFLLWQKLILTILSSFKKLFYLHIAYYQTDRMLAVSKSKFYG